MKVVKLHRRQELFLRIIVMRPEVLAILLFNYWPAESDLIKSTIYV